MCLPPKSELFLNAASYHDRRNPHRWRTGGAVGSGARRAGSLSQLRQTATAARVASSIAAVERDRFCPTLRGGSKLEILEFLLQGEA
jgi:hypothetical protein